MTLTHCETECNILAQNKKRKKKNPTPKKAGGTNTPSNEKRNIMVRVVALILCLMMVAGVFSILLYTLSGG